MVELFGLARPEFERWVTGCRSAPAIPGPLRAAGGIRFDAPYTLRALDRAGTIIIPGWRRPWTEVPEVLRRKLRRAHAEGARLLSVCSGAFVLAAAGFARRPPLRPRIGSTPKSSLPSIRRSLSIPTCCTSTKVGS